MIKLCRSSDCFVQSQNFELKVLIITSLHSNKEVFPNLFFNPQSSVLISDITIKPFLQRASPSDIHVHVHVWAKIRKSNRGLKEEIQ